MLGSKKEHISFKDRILHPDKTERAEARNRLRALHKKYPNKSLDELKRIYINERTVRSAGTGAAFMAGANIGGQIALHNMGINYTPGNRVLGVAIDSTLGAAVGGTYGALKRGSRRRMIEKAIKEGQR